MVQTRKVRLKRRARKQEPSKKSGTVFAVLLLVAIGMFMLVVRFTITREQEQLNRTANLESEGLYFSLEMNKDRYSRGEDIEVTLKVKNISTEPVVLDFETEQEFDFLVQREMNLLFANVPMNVWRLSSARHPSSDAHTITIAPGKEKSFSDKWDQTDYNSRLVKPGRYVITGFLMAKNRQETLQLRGKTK